MIDVMFAEDSAEAYATRQEGAEWSTYTPLSFEHWDYIHTDPKARLARRHGYKIIVFPKEGVIYDFIAKVKQEFTCNGRGTIIERI